MASVAEDRPADSMMEGATPEAVVVRFAGDSGDGMQLTSGQFTLSTALAGNDLATFPDFPAEIRAPQGTLFGQNSTGGAINVITTAVFKSFIATLPVVFEKDHACFVF